MTEFMVHERRLERAPLGVSQDDTIAADRPVVGVYVVTEHDLPEVCQADPGSDRRFAPPRGQVAALLLPGERVDLRSCVPNIDPVKDAAAARVILPIGQISPVRNTVRRVLAAGQEEVLPSTT